MRGVGAFVPMKNISKAFDLILPPFVLGPEFTGLALKPKRWLCGRRSGGEGVAAFAMKHIQPFVPNS